VLRSLIVSPSAPIRNVPYTATSRGPVEEKDLVVRPRVEPAAPCEPRRESAKQAGSKSAKDHPWWHGYEQRMKLQRLKGSQVSPLVGVSASASP
jgi:hypothetical protein